MIVVAVGDDGKGGALDYIGYTFSCRRRRAVRLLLCFVVGVKVPLLEQRCQHAMLLWRIEKNIKYRLNIKCRWVYGVSGMVGKNDTHVCSDTWSIFVVAEIGNLDRATKQVGSATREKRQRVSLALLCGFSICDWRHAISEAAS